MLVARFPEFDRSHGGMAVKMDSPAWAAVSDSAKDLIRHLMNVDPMGRYSVNQVSRGNETMMVVVIVGCFLTHDLSC